MLLKQSRCYRELAGADLVASGTAFGIHWPVKSHIIKCRTKRKDQGNCRTAVRWEKTRTRSFCNQTGSMKLVQTSVEKNQHQSKNRTVVSKTLLHSRDLFAVQWVCFQSDIIRGLAGIPRWGLWLPRQHWKQTQPRKWMCQITQCHPLGKSCRCVRVCASACVCRCCEFYFHRGECVVTCISSHPLPRAHLSHPASHLSLLLFFFCSHAVFFMLTHTKCNLSSSTSVSHRHDLHFLCLLLLTYYNL